MTRFRLLRLLPGLTLLAALSLPAIASAKKNDVPVWTDPAIALAEDPDFAIQGEYGSTEPGASIGA